MKKLTTLLTTLLLSAVMCVFIFALSGCRSEETFTEKTYQSGENSLQGIIIQVTDREIEICVSDDSKVYIDYYDSEKEYLDITLSKDNLLSVKLALNKELLDFIGTKPAKKYRKIQIKMPSNLIHKLAATTTNENIKVTSLSFKDSLSLDTNGGNIICERIGVEKEIKLNAKNGNITGTVLGSFEDFSILCTIKKGDSNLPTAKENGIKSLVADCNNGNINIEFVK